MNTPNDEPKSFRLPEDWLAIVLAFAIILLSVLGVLGPSGLTITF